MRFPAWIWMHVVLWLAVPVLTMPVDEVHGDLVKRAPTTINPDVIINPPPR
jgi:hypothetical protein